MRAAVEDRLGSPIVSVVSQSAGFSPGVPARLRSEDGRRFFAKAAEPLPNPLTPAAHRREAKVAAALPERAPVPRLVLSHDEGEGVWIVLVCEDVEGRNPAVPWRSRELDQIRGTLVTVFEPDVAQTLSTPMDFEVLCDYLAGVIGGSAVCCAIRVDGRFEYVKTRSVPRQHKPYPPLVEVVANQPTFELRGVSGSLVGFRFPDYAQGLNVSGYHFHFITADRSAGGHVLGCTLTSGELFIDREGDLRLELPPDVGLPIPDQSAEKGETLDRIERE